MVITRSQAAAAAANDSDSELYSDSDHEVEFEFEPREGSRDATYGVLAAVMAGVTMGQAVLYLAEDADDSRVRLVLSTHAVLTLTVVMLVAPRLRQDESYHDFADGRGACCVPNALNVVSNVPFLMVGVLGLANDLAPVWNVFYSAVAAVAAGSAYYHWKPSSATLEWDRLPMVVAFMSLFGMVLNDRLGTGEWVTLPLITLGVASVVHWREQNDLRPYALVQFYPMLVIPALCALRPATDPMLSADRLASSMVCYAAAKAFELADRGVYRCAGVVSGHTLKHLAAAAAVACLLPDAGYAPP
jgi:hypothetical protein